MMRATCVYYLCGSLSISANGPCGRIHQRARAHADMQTHIDGLVDFVSSLSLADASKRQIGCRLVHTHTHDHYTVWSVRSYMQWTTIVKCARGASNNIKETSASVHRHKQSEVSESTSQSQSQSHIFYTYSCTHTRSTEHGHMQHCGSRSSKSIVAHTWTLRSVAHTHSWATFTDIARFFAHCSMRANTHTRTNAKRSRTASHSLLSLSLILVFSFHPYTHHYYYYCYFFFSFIFPQYYVYYISASQSLVDIQSVRTACTYIYFDCILKLICVRTDKLLIRSEGIENKWKRQRTMFNAQTHPMKTAGHWVDGENLNFAKSNSGSHEIIWIVLFLIANTKLAETSAKSLSANSIGDETIEKYLSAEVKIIAIGKIEGKKILKHRYNPMRFEPMQSQIACGKP